MKNIKFKIIGIIMIIFAVFFVFYALNHPEISFAWSNKITYFIYAGYVIVAVLMFVVPVKAKK